MQKINLTSEQIFNLKTRHKNSRDGKERDRIKAILLRAKGWSLPMIAEALLIHETSITRYISDYQSKDKLTLESGGSKSHLNEEQTCLLVTHLSEITYVHTHQICSYVLERWSIKYAVSGMNKWLHANGFSYKLPKGVPHKFDEEKQAQFIAFYEALKASAKEDEPILFMDAVHPTQATKITSGWIKTGVDKPINTTGSRTRINIVGAIRLGHLSDALVQQYDKTINGESIVDFLQRTRDFYQTSGTINLVLDGAGYHRSGQVVDKAKELNIILHYLPPYSPNLNPIERLWKVMNEYARNNKYFATAKEFRRKIDEFFDVTLRNIGDALNNRINDNFQTLSSAK
jgi:transposase